MGSQAKGPNFALLATLQAHGNVIPIEDIPFKNITTYQYLFITVRNGRTLKVKQVIWLNGYR